MAAGSHTLQSRAMEFFGSDSDEEDTLDNHAIDQLLAACMRLVPPLAGLRPALRLGANSRCFADRAAAAGFDVVTGACDVLLVDDVEAGSSSPDCGIVAIHHSRGLAVRGMEKVFPEPYMLEWAGEGAAVYGRLPAVDRVGCPPRPPADMNEACRCARLVVATRRAAGRLPASSYVDRAARVLRREGLVILPGLFDKDDADALCRDALDDFERCR